MNTTSVAKLIAAASLFVSPLAASAQNTGNQGKTEAAAPAASAASIKDDAAGSKKICKRLPTSGSRLPNKACLTAEQWKQVEADSQ